MARRLLTIDGAEWAVTASGRSTQYTRDEFGLIFTRGSGRGRERRVARYSPLGAKSRELSLARLTDFELTNLFRTSQPAWTAPETGYRR